MSTAVNTTDLQMLCSPLVPRAMKTNGDRDQGLSIDYSDGAVFPLLFSPIHDSNLARQLLEKYSHAVDKAISISTQASMNDKTKNLLQRRKRISMHVNTMLDNLKEFTLTPSKIKIGGDSVSAPTSTTGTTVPVSVMPVTPKRLAAIRQKVAGQDEYALLCDILAAGLTADEIIEQVAVNLAESPCKSTVRLMPTTPGDNDRVPPALQQDGIDENSQPKDQNKENFHGGFIEQNDANLLLKSNLDNFVKRHDNSIRPFAFDS